jgi:translation initiation factor IF-3
MVVGAAGDQLGKLDIESAMERARDAELDLVEVAPNADPPVCKIMDFGKHKYRLSKKAHDAKKRQKIIKVKEVKIRPNTDKHDYDFKVNNAKRFLGDGDKVKVSVFFRGRQIAHSELGIDILHRIVKDLEDVALVEQEAKQEGRNMFMVLAPRSPEDIKKIEKQREAEAKLAESDDDSSTEEKVTE